MKNKISYKEVPVAKGNELGEYEEKSVQKTLDNSYVPEIILDARNKQDEIIFARYLGKKVAIADIGCGDGYHGEKLAPECSSYHGFEISAEMVKKTRKLWKDKGLKNALVVEGDAAELELEPESYDVAWSLYFTPGNFREEFTDLQRYDDEYLNKNPKFIAIISRFFSSLRAEGRMFLTVYKDTPATEAAQRKFYQDTGQKVITPLGSRFVATAENFWSVRWTKESMLSNLEACGVDPRMVVFHDLNDSAWLVEIIK